MNYRLYQIDPDRDRDHVGFLGLAAIEKYQVTPEVNRSIYEMTYEGQRPEDGGTMYKRGSGYICRDCRGKEKK